MSIKLIVLASMSLAACTSKPEPVSLPSKGDIPYRTWLRTYHDGDYADQPFELFLRSKTAKLTTRVLSADQCKDVTVVQAPITLHVFYDALLVTGFNGTEPSYHDHPLARLCPRQSQDCADLERRFAKLGRRPVNVCTYQTRPST